MADTKASKLVLYSDFDINQLQFSPPSVNNKQQKTAWVKYQGKRCMIQTPEVTFPFGITSYQNKPENNKTLALQLDNPKFLEVVRAIDAKVLAYVHEHCEAFFGKRYTPEFLEDLFRSNVKYGKDDKYPPTLRIKIQDTVKYCDSNSEEVDRCYLTKQSKGKCMMQLGAVYFMDKSFGLPLYAHNVQVLEQPVQDFGFIAENNVHGHEQEYE